MARGADAREIPHRVIQHHECIPVVVQIIEEVPELLRMGTLSERAQACGDVWAPGRGQVVHAEVKESRPKRDRPLERNRTGCPATSQCHRRADVVVV